MKIDNRINYMLITVPKETLMFYKEWKEFQFELQELQRSEGCYLRILEIRYNPANFNELTLLYVKE